jgi:hypothetical protein
MPDAGRGTSRKKLTMPRPERCLSGGNMSLLMGIMAG